MTNQEIQEMLEESWYWSTIEDMIVLFQQHGRDNVLRDVAKKMQERENQRKQEQQ